jgi:hypothetical protein
MPEYFLIIIIDTNNPIGNIPKSARHIIVLDFSMTDSKRSYNYLLK